MVCEKDVKQFNEKKRSPFSQVVQTQLGADIKWVKVETQKCIQKNRESSKGRQRRKKRKKKTRQKETLFLSLPRYNTNQWPKWKWTHKPSQRKKEKVVGTRIQQIFPK